MYSLFNNMTVPFGLATMSCDTWRVNIHVEHSSRSVKKELQIETKDPIVFRAKKRLHEKIVKAKGKTVSGLNYALLNKHEWGSEGMAPCILNLDNRQRSVSTPLSPYNMSRKKNIALITTSKCLRYTLLNIACLYFSDINRRRSSTIEHSIYGFESHSGNGRTSVYFVCLCCAV